jgi:two-component system, cell cycle sensor histidine kinase and response regulator CckA
MNVAIEDMPIPALWVTREHRIAAHSPSAEVLLGTGGRSLSNIAVHAVIPELTPEVLARALSGPVRLQSLGGAPRAVEIVASAGQGSGFVVILNAVDDRQRLEQLLRRTQRLDAAGRLAAGLIHDVKNVLTAVLGFSEVMTADLAPSDPSRGDAEEIHHAALRASILTDQLLGLVRGDRSVPAIVDLNDVLRDMGRLLRLAVGAKVMVELRLEASPLRVHVVPGAIDQLLLNLAINARDAMPEGGVLIVESLLRAGAAVLRITDTGTGMSRSTRERIFEPFFTTKPPGAGTGLGLTIVRSIVEEASGQLTVESRPGEGSIFEVAVPLVTAGP